MRVTRLCSYQQLDPLSFSMFRVAAIVRCARAGCTCVRSPIRPPAIVAKHDNTYVREASLPPRSDSDLDFHCKEASCWNLSGMACWSLFPEQVGNSWIYSRSYRPEWNMSDRACPLNRSHFSMRTLTCRQILILRSSKRSSREMASTFFRYWRY